MTKRLRSRLEGKAGRGAPLAQKGIETVSITLMAAGLGSPCITWKQVPLSLPNYKAEY